jgi:hypothetical protein
MRVARCINIQRQSEALPFAKAFAAPALERIFEDESREEARECGPFATEVTLFAFLSQVIDDDPSCAAAVGRINAERMASGKRPCSTHNSSFCKARERLPLALLTRLCHQCSESLENDVPNAWLWHGKHVKVIDGTMLTAPDSIENRRAYPQHHGFKSGLGFPTVRLVALTSLATGAVLDCELGPSCGIGQGELSLGHRLLRSVSKGDVVVGDRLYPGFPFIGELLERGADFVGRLANRSPLDFRRGKRLGPHDHLVSWKKGRSQCIDEAALAALPDEIVVREVIVTVESPGKKTRHLRLVTTLLSRNEYPPEALAELYFRRWHIELDFRAIKQVLHMDVLRCQTPSMLCREVWAHLLAYNVVRKLMAMAGHAHDVEPRRLSFKAALQTLKAYKTLWASGATNTRDDWLDDVLRAIAQNRVGNRPGRSEPRQIKRNPKTYDMLKKPRAGRRGVAK